MIKALVSIEVDLASSFAIRYACQLGNLLNLELYPVYVKFPSLELPMTGVGWVRHTWEKEIVRKGKEEIQEMLAVEMESCPQLHEPRVIFGDREHELDSLIKQETFDLYVEGAPYPFTPTAIFKRLHAKLYQHLNCPLIWLRGVRKIDQVLVLGSALPNAQDLVKRVGRFWQGCSIPLHLGYPLQEKDDWRVEVGKAREELASQGCQVVLQGYTPQAGGMPPLEITRNYGLVILALDRNVKKDGLELQWLSQVKAPLMLVLV